MAPKNWLEHALQLARNGDTTAEFRRHMLDQQVRRCMDGMEAETKLKVSEDRARGLLRKV